MKLVVCFALLAACERDQSAKIDLLRYQRALEAAASDPEAGWDGCATLSDEGLEGDCRLAVIEAWAGHKGEPTQALLERCATLEPAARAAECAFQVGERRQDPAGCARAGAYEDDCRLHLATADFGAWMPRGARLDDGELHRRMAAEAEAVGLHADDLRVWSAFFRRVYMQQVTLDREACSALVAPLDRSCRETGLQVYTDRLNMAHSQGMLPCEGEALPAFVQTGGDAELEEILRARARPGPCPQPRSQR